VSAPAGAAAVHRVRAEVRQALRSLGVDDDGAALELAAGEVVANAHEHGHPPVTVEVRVRRDEVVVVVHDAGGGPTTPGLPASRPPVDAVRGRGRWLAHQLAVVEERRTPAGHEVRLTRRRAGRADLPSG
jgi:anti-sigma regulatory factor (Ser/Thr protein kinase)